MRAYLDHNATAPLRPEARAALTDAAALPANPSSVHAEGRRARAVIEAARSEIAALVGGGSAELVFTSGATEANHLALAGLGLSEPPANAAPRPVFAVATEHDSVLAQAPMDGRIAVDGAGRIDLEALAVALAPLRSRPATAPPAIVAVMLANNETGVLQPVADAAAVAHAHGALLHCDAVQAAGRVAIDFQALGIDSLALSAHKLGGPAGVGALIVRSGLPLRPVQRGGGQERFLRAGTENVAGIAAFAAAARVAGGRLTAEAERLTELRHRLEVALLGADASAAALVGASSPPLRPLSVSAMLKERGATLLPNTLSIALPGIEAQTQLIALDLEGVATSAGAACSSGKLRPSHVLTAMGLPPAIAACTLRFSLGWSTDSAEIAFAAAAYRRMLGRLSAVGIARQGSAGHPL